MTIVVPNEGAQKMLWVILGEASNAAEDLKMDLYQNDITPGESDTKSTYTVFAGGGYSGSKTLSMDSWTVTLADPAEASYAQQTWTFTGSSANSAYGYYVFGNTSNKLYWAERFGDGPYAIANNGDEIRVTPKISLD